MGLFPLLFLLVSLTVPSLCAQYSVSVYSKKVPARMLVFIMVIEMCPVLENNSVIKMKYKEGT